MIPASFVALSSSKTMGPIPFALAIAAWLCESMAKCHRDAAAFSFASGVPDVRRLTIAVIAPALMSMVRRSSAIHSSSSTSSSSSLSSCPSAESALKGVAERETASCMPLASALSVAFSALRSSSALRFLRFLRCSARCSARSRASAFRRSRIAMLPLASSAIPAAATSWIAGVPCFESETSSGMQPFSTTSVWLSILEQRYQIARAACSWPRGELVGRMSCTSRGTPSAAIIASCISSSP